MKHCCAGWWFAGGGVRKNTKELHFLAKLLNIFHLNLQRGLQQKLDKLQIDRQQLNPDILMVIEHGFSKGLIENTNIPHYKLQADFSRTEHRWGVEQQSIQQIHYRLDSKKYTQSNTHVK